MNFFIASLIFMFSSPGFAAEKSLYLAETEAHSTGGIANNAASRYNQNYPETTSTGEYHYPEYIEENDAEEELQPPTSVEQVSPTRSKVITRTTSRPSSNNPQGIGVGIAPVVAPIYDSGENYPSPLGNIPPQPASKR